MPLQDNPFVNQFAKQETHAELCDRARCRLNTLTDMLSSIQRSQFSVLQCDNLINEIGREIAQIGGDLRQRSFELKQAVDSPQKEAAVHTLGVNDMPF
jgi:hypothetical protein